MDKKTKDALEVIEKIMSKNDVVYEVFRSEKKSGLFYFWDIIFESTLSMTNSIKNDKVMYLLAAEKSGKLLEVENGNIKNIIEVPNWTRNNKENFKKVIIEDYVYKKFRRLL